MLAKLVVEVTVVNKKSMEHYNQHSCCHAFASALLLVGVFQLAISVKMT
jgi:hypothetical protein